MNPWVGKAARLMAAFLVFAGAASVNGLANNLTPGSQLLSGSSTGQITEAQPASINLLPGASLWNFGWATTGAATIAVNGNAMYQWDGGFSSATIGGTGPSDKLTQTVTASSGSSSYTFSGQFSVSQSLTATSVVPSSNVVIALQYIGGGRTDTLTFNPATGQLLSSTGISSASIQLFSAETYTSTPNNGITKSPVFYVSMTSLGVSLATTSVAVSITPNGGTGTRNVVVGGPQLEPSAYNSAFIPTNNTFVTRPTGVIPRQTQSLASANTFVPNNYTTQPAVDAFNTLLVTPGNTVNLNPNGGGVLETIELNGTTGQITINASPFCIQGPGISGCSTSITFPFAASGLPYASVTLRLNAGGYWEPVASNLAAISGGGGGSGTPGGNPNDVQYNAGGGNFGGSDVFTWSGTLPVVINGNAAALPTPLTGDILQLGQADTVNTRIELDAFGALPVITAKRADGTNTAPTAIQSNENLLTLTSQGYNGSAYTNDTASIILQSAENWTPSALGTCLVVTTTATGTTSRQQSMKECAGTLTLGLAGGIVGALAVQNATTGTITLSPPTGALGTIAQTLTDAAGTIPVVTGALVNGNCVQSNGTQLLDAGAPCGGGSGTVTSVSVTTANGVSGSVATPTTTPAISLTLGNIVPTSVTGIINSNGLLTQSGFETGLTGGAGQSVLNASATKSIHVLTTCASNNGITLPSSSLTATNGQIHVVLNNGASANCKVWPDLGATLGDGTNTAMTIFTNAACSFIQTAASTWKPLFNCPSGTGANSVNTNPAADGTFTPSLSNTVTVNTTLNMGSVVFCPQAAPTISSGFGTSPSVVHGAACSFSVNVGTGGTASTGVIGLPTATNEWNCSVTAFNPASSQLLNTTEVTARSASSVTLTNVVTSTGIATAWPASLVLMMDCGGA